MNKITPDWSVTWGNLEMNTFYYLASSHERKLASSQVLHELGKQCCFQYRLRSASALSPIENKLETRRNHEQWKAALTSLTKQHLWNKHFLTVSCWLKWTSARPRCTAGILEPLSRDLFGVFVRQWQQGHEVQRFGPDSCGKNKSSFNTYRHLNLFLPPHTICPARICSHGALQPKTNINSHLTSNSKT